MTLIESSFVWEALTLVCFFDLMLLSSFLWVMMSSKFLIETDRQTCRETNRLTDSFGTEAEQRQGERERKKLREIQKDS